MAVTPYPYAVGKDPQFDAAKAKYDFAAYDAQLTADRRRREAQEDYQAALQSLEQQGTVGRRNLDTNMLTRGVFKSGETNRRRAELEASLLQGRQQADTGLANLQGQVSADLQRAMISNSLDWEMALSAALARGRGGSGGAGGGGGGGVMPQGPSQAAPGASDVMVRLQPPSKPKVAPKKLPTYASRYS